MGFESKATEDGLLLPQTADEIIAIGMERDMAEQQKIQAKKEQDEKDFQEWLNSEETREWKREQMEYIKTQIETLILTTSFCKIWPWLTRPTSAHIKYTSYKTSKNIRQRVHDAECEILMDEIRKVPGYSVSPCNDHCHVSGIHLEISADLWKTLKNPQPSTKC